MSSASFVPPAYPYERLNAIRAMAENHEGGAIDCSVGTPCDPPLAAVVAALAGSGAERGYPTSAGSPILREAISDWFFRRFAVSVSRDDVAACVGTKEFVASTAGFMALRDPDRDVVLFPDISYPTYEMGAILAGLRPVRVPLVKGRLILEAIDPEDAARAVMVWSNSPSNPTGYLDDLSAVASWGRVHDVPVFSDECYCEFTWSRAPETMLSHGLDGVVAVHSLSKRSNLAGLRVGFYAGDPSIVNYLRSVRQHAGLMVPGPAQAAGAVALNDDAHVEQQRSRYMNRLSRLVDALTLAGFPCELPEGGFYLWIEVPSQFDDAFAAAAFLAEISGLVVSPGEFYGPSASRYLRVAVVQPDDRIALAATRLTAAT
jgi:succinyldiaminopimelate transaminase